uniref:Uncharacterized protein MANES_01G047500 n=1 Tax=Rhizophora mucronata TaxID=61149 RepID=A0A2P2LL91_RHIMU
MYLPTQFRKVQSFPFILGNDIAGSGLDNSYTVIFTSRLVFRDDKERKEKKEYTCLFKIFQLHDLPYLLCNAFSIGHCFSSKNIRVHFHLNFNHRRNLGSENRNSCYHKFGSKDLHVNLLMCE